ncbi:hypothetical protein [Massilia sp. TN1-12]|uniref:hypothetical protein n=1 Tax=Massilia paldalensis TaxID=3377675 RepID=UPI0038517A16
MTALTIFPRIALLPILSALLLAGVPAAAAPANAAAPVTATLTMRTPDSLEIAYALPPACKALAFVNDGVKAQAAVHLRSDWTPADDCTAVDFQSVRPTRASCRTLRLRVPATTRAADTRVYGQAEPWAQPIGGGLYAHTSAYAVHGCGAVDWRFAAPGGTVMVDGTVAPESVTRSSSAAHGGGLAAVLLHQPYRSDAPPFHAEDAVPPATRAMLAATLDESLGALRALLPGVHLTPAYVLAVPDDAPGLRAGVANGTVLRLLVPTQEPADLREQARELIAHETAHLAQPPHWPAPPGEDAGALREGGAEFLRLAIALRQGWLTPDAFRDALEAAVNGCAAAAGRQPWRAIEGRGKDPLARRCGLALHVLALSHPGPTPPLQRLQALYGKGGAQDPAGAARALECGDAAGCTPQLVTALRGVAPLRTVLEDEMRRSGAVLTATPAWGPQLTEAMTLHHLELLVRADCHGRAGIYPNRKAPRIGPGLRCGVLRDGMVPATAEGLPLFAGPDAIAASRAACRTRGATTIGMRDGASVTVRCGQAAGLEERVFGIDAERATQLVR